MCTGRKHLSSARPRLNCQPVNRGCLCRRADGPCGRRRTMRSRDGVRAEPFRRYTPLETCAACCSRTTRLGCAGRRNCNVNLDDLRGDRPEIDCEPQQARGIPCNLQPDETVGAAAVGGCGVIAGVVGGGGKSLEFGCGISGLGGLSVWPWQVAQRRRRPVRLRVRQW
jgi:hypothetical protein